MGHYHRPLAFSRQLSLVGKLSRTRITVGSGSLRASSSSTAAGPAGPAEVRGDLTSLLARVAGGDLSPDAAASKLSPLLVSGGAQAEDVGGFAKIDHDRRRRVGFPEVVFGDGKSAQQIARILTAMIREHQSRQAQASVEEAGVGAADAAASPIVATRVSPEKWSRIARDLPGQLTYHQDARIVSFGAPPSLAGSGGGSQAAGAGFRGGVSSAGGGSNDAIGKVAVLSAGTSDLAIAEEAAVLAELAGAEVSRFHDVGVAGIHRLLAAIPSVEKAGVAICVAGMDGAMPGVVAGLVKCPVVAVPTSVGYGAAMSGLAPLLTMLNACAPGVSVVNIDNGFGAAAFAVKLLKSGKATAADSAT